MPIYRPSRARTRCPVLVKQPNIADLARPHSGERCRGLARGLNRRIVVAPRSASFWSRAARLAIGAYKTEQIF